MRALACGVYDGYIVETRRGRMPNGAPAGRFGARLHRLRHTTCTVPPATRGKREPARTRAVVEHKHFDVRRRKQDRERVAASADPDARAPAAARADTDRVLAAAPAVRQADRTPQTKSAALRRARRRPDAARHQAGRPTRQSRNRWRRRTTRRRESRTRCRS